MDFYGGPYRPFYLGRNAPKRRFNIDSLLEDDTVEQVAGGSADPVAHAAQAALPPLPHGPVAYPWPAAGHFLLAPHLCCPVDLVYVQAYPQPPAPPPAACCYLPPAAPQAVSAAAGTVTEGAAADYGNGATAFGPPAANPVGLVRGQAEARPYRGRMRPRFTAHQLDALEAEFAFCPRPNAAKRDTLAARIGLTPTQVTSWFQNQRVFYKKQPPRALHGPAEGNPSPPAPPGSL